MKRIVILVTLLLTIATASAATVTLDKSIYETGETIDITVSDCPDGTTATAHIGTLWADQGTISGGSWNTQYQISATFPSIGSSQTVDAYCAATTTANFCVNPGCSTGESNEGSSSGGSGGGGAGSPLVVSDEDSTSTESSTGGTGTGSSYSSTTESTPEKSTDSPGSETDEKQDDERGSSLGIIITLLIMALIIAGGFFLWRKYRKPAGYAPMPQTQ